MTNKDPASALVIAALVVALTAAISTRVLAEHKKAA